MTEETNEDFGRDDRNFHPEEQRIIWETMQNKEPAIDQHEEYSLSIQDYSSKDNYHDQTDDENDSDNDDQTQDIELDKELKEYSDKKFDQKDHSDS